ncbi:MAG: ATPase, AAA superfamily [Promethearchaeota archaeon CR_4]|nr:MAG: ATPase, AAA superfamily [Candidatus Lokiarchaeota archaeon CR_4]
MTESKIPYLVDTSVVINQRILKLIQKGNLGEKPEILLSQIVIAEIENQANQKKESGIIALGTLLTLKKMEKDGTIILRTVGDRPTLEQINLNPSGELDARIRMEAKKNNAHLITSDHIQAEIAEVESIPTTFVMHKEKPDEEALPKFPHISEFFDPETLSVHLKEGISPLAKKGVPGRWRMENIGDEILTAHHLNALASKILGDAKEDPKSFIEIQDAAGATVVQLREYRIVITRPPFSNAVEITAVRPLIKLHLDDYELSEKLVERLKKAEGVLVSGSPGAGKSTFVAALAELYVNENKIVKTLEGVRDLQVPPQVTQYSPIKGAPGRTEDILLLVRPDYTLYDEVRTTKDFEVYTDMRLAGVGMVGVVHASSAIDAVQRFISRVEMGMLPSIIDTIVHIHDGHVEQILGLKLSVKVPQGIMDRELARPVVDAYNYETGEVEFEIYTFGDNVVVSPVSGGSRREHGAGGRKRRFDGPPPEGPRNGNEIYFHPNITKKNIILSTNGKFGQKMVSIYIGGKFTFNGVISNNGDLRIGMRSSIGKRIMKAIRNSEQIYGLIE